VKLSTRITLAVLAVLLIPVVVGLQTRIDPMRKEFQPGHGVSSVVVKDMKNNPVVLPSQFVAGTLIGMQEVVAGLLWVRTDEFFHSGNYEAIVPMVRMITWLDPHQIDVYSVGAWHLDYNFVDSSQRADHRYFIPAVKFLEEGVKNNPDIPDLYFDLGFVHYFLKAQDFKTANYWMEKSTEHNPALYAYREIAHDYEKQGDIDACIAQWQKCIEIGRKGMEENPNDSLAKNHYQVSKRNLDELLVRRVQRADIGKRMKSVDFQVEFHKDGPRVFEVDGKINLPDSSRINLTLTDDNYKEPDLKTFSWQVPPDVTALWETGIHGISIQKGKFHRKYDLSKDIKQYPFKSGKYTLTMWFNPLTATPDIQDVTGWHGEAITDPRYLDTSTPGVRMVKKVIHLTQKDIL